MTERRVDTPHWALSAGEKIHSFDNRLPLTGLVRLLAGSSSPVYVQAAWERAEHVIDGYTDWPVELPIAKADPNASLLAIMPRFRKKAAVFSDGGNVNETRATHKGTRVAVAYTAGERTSVGSWPGEITRLVRQGSPGNEVLIAAMRSGRNDFGAAIGLWSSKDRVFFLPPGSKIIENNVPIDVALPYHYPGVPLF